METNVSVPGAVFGSALILLVLWDAFETVVFPRRVTRKLRLARTFYRHSWLLWSTFSAALFSARRREQLLSFYGPLSLIILLSLWAGILISGFALLYWASGPFLQAAAVHSGFGTSLYFSGTTFFTLGLGDTIEATLKPRPGGGITGVRTFFHASPADERFEESRLRESLGHAHSA